MKRIHIIGRKNSGKTTLVVDLVQQLTAQGIRVGTIKHTHHHHELDTPGKDSHRHREAGASGVGILSPGACAVFWPVQEPNDEAQYALIEKLFGGFDIVLVEGDSMTSAPKIEVWRIEIEEPLIASKDSSVLAIISDDKPDAFIPVLPRSDIEGLAKAVLEMAK